MNFNLKKYLVFSTAAFGVLNVSETMSTQSSYYSNQYDNQYVRDTNTNLLPKMNPKILNGINNNNKYTFNNKYNLNNNLLPKMTTNTYVRNHNLFPKINKNILYRKDKDTDNYFINNTVTVNNKKQNNEIMVDKDYMNSELDNACSVLCDVIESDKNAENKKALGSYYNNISPVKSEKLRSTSLNFVTRLGIQTRDEFIKQITGLVAMFKYLQDAGHKLNLSSISMFNNSNNTLQFNLANIISTLKNYDGVLNKIISIINNYRVSDDIKILNILECLCNNTWLCRGEVFGTYLIRFLNETYGSDPNKLLIITANGKVHFGNGISLSTYVGDSIGAQPNDKSTQFLLDLIYDNCMEDFDVEPFQNSAFGVLIDKNIITKEFIEKSIPTLREFKTPYDILYWLKSPNMPVDDKLKNENPVMNGGEHGEGSGNQQNNNNTPGTPNNEKFVEIKGLSDALKNLGCQNNKVFVEASPEKLKDATEIRLENVTVKNLAEALQKNGKVAIDMRGLTMGKRLNLSEKTGVEKMFKAWSGGVNGWLDNKNSVFINVVLEK